MASFDGLSGDLTQSRFPAWREHRKGPWSFKLSAFPTPEVRFRMLDTVHLVEILVSVVGEEYSKSNDIRQPISASTFKSVSDF
jgi:hypothetical protein